MIKAMLIAGAGGFVGTCGRYALTRLCALLWPGAFPLGTLLVNLAGCFVIGLLLGVLERFGAVGSSVALLLITGFCGGFTTFSTFSVDLVALGSGGQWLPAGGYLLLSVGGGIALTLAGRSLATLGV